MTASPSSASLWQEYAVLPLGDARRREIETAWRTRFAELSLRAACENPQAVFEQHAIATKYLPLADESMLAAVYGRLGELIEAPQTSPSDRLTAKLLAIAPFPSPSDPWLQEVEAALPGDAALRRRYEEELSPAVQSAFR